jgi:hypothetical protein
MLTGAAIGRWRCMMSERLDALEQRILEEAGWDFVLEQESGRLTVRGTVDTEAERQSALRLVAEHAPGLSLQDELYVTGISIEPDPAAGEVVFGEDEDLPAEQRGRPSVEAGDFQDEPAVTVGYIASGPSAALDDDVVGEGDRVFSPPTDPVGTNTEVIGGLQASSMDSVEVERSSDGTLGDEAIADAIRREIREDAATTALEIAVDVNQGVVRLRGSVEDLEDAENVEEVAFRVPGVADVIDELRIESMSR